MPGRSGDSELARYIDRLERGLRQLRPQDGYNFWHAAAGALTGGSAMLMAVLRPLTLGMPLLPLAAAAAAAGALAFAEAGRRHWNFLAGSPLAALRNLARGNLLDGELLLLALESELPARYERLRYAAQSYGKTRARNYSELRRGSMVDRVQWLIENYRVICAALGRPSTLPGLARRQRNLALGMLAPLLLVILGIALIPFAAPGLTQELALGLMFGGLALLLLACGAASGLAVQLQLVERGALASVLVELLDLTNPQPAADAALVQTGTVSAGDAGSGTTAAPQPARSVEPE